ncbi:hypothetical protein P0D69_39950 [Paraburkholderia sediminicola]|uniref:hypothetical protein n=1 Tax=Paraburkholderia sediminicola TaxID=458836 RepID=UPI0038BC87DE
MDAVAGARRWPKRSHVIVRLALDMGLRSSEIAHLMIRDIDWRAGTVTLRGTKSLRLPACRCRWHAGRRWLTICNTNVRRPATRPSLSGG